MEKRYKVIFFSAITAAIIGAVGLIYDAVRSKEINPPQETTQSDGGVIYEFEEFIENTLYSPDEEREMSSPDIVGIAAADIDRDGKKDLLVFYRQEDGTCKLEYLNSQELGPEDGPYSNVRFGRQMERASFTCPAGLQTLVSGDFNGDGMDELVYLTPNNNIHTLVRRTLRSTEDPRVNNSQ